MIEDVNLYFQLIGEMKGFILQYIAHSARRPLSSSCEARAKIKSVSVCVCVCGGSDRVQIGRLLTLDEEQPLDGNWLTRCSSRCIQITVFNLHHASGLLRAITGQCIDNRSLHSQVKSHYFQDPCCIHLPRPQQSLYCCFFSCLTVTVKCLWVIFLSLFEIHDFVIL